MKNIILILFLATRVFAADTNQTILQQVTVNAKDQISTNLNEIIIDILRGAKSAGGEVYQASKTAITKSVDFTMEQAPLVVREFLNWQIAEAVGYLLISSMVGCLLLFFARKLKQALPEIRSSVDRDFSRVVVWVMRIVASFIILISIGVNGMTIAKVVVAPRVFLIEYVVDQMNGHPNK